MNSISQVKYFSEANLIRVSFQFEIEAAIMSKNSLRFKLAYSSPLLQEPLLDKYGLYREMAEVRSLVDFTIMLEENDLNRVLLLFKKDNDINISSAISPTEWS